MSTKKKDSLDEMIKGINSGQQQIGNAVISANFTVIRQILHEIVRLMHSEENYDNEVVEENAKD